MEHHHHEDLSGRKLLIVTILNFVITAAEVAGGIFANSLALLSDALHNFSDGLAILIAYIAHKISRRPSDERKTFGYRRIQILAALFNAVVLIAISIYLFYEAWQRLLEPEPIKGLIMFIVALVGLLANAVAVVMLKKDSNKNINIRAAYLHLLGDTLSSVAVVTGGILIYFFEWYWVDPIITFAIGIYIIIETWRILKESVNILMQASPADINLKQLKKELEDMPEISNIHHIHLWSLDDRSVHFECHVDLVENLHIKDVEPIRNKIHNTLHNSYHIDHITIQFEHDWCDEKEMIHR